jgi:hypothetical protein
MHWVASCDLDILQAVAHWRKLWKAMDALAHDLRLHCWIVSPSHHAGYTLLPVALDLYILDCYIVWPMLHASCTLLLSF